MKNRRRFSTDGLTKVHQHRSTEVLLGEINLTTDFLNGNELFCYNGLGLVTIVRNFAWASEMVHEAFVSQGIDLSL